MTNNDELALNLKSAAEKALPAIEKYEAGEIDGDDALEMLSDFTDVIKPANILALLAERDADKKQISSWSCLAKKNVEEHEKAVIALDAARQRIADLESKLTQNESWLLAAQKYIADLESRTVNVNRTVGCDACGGNGSVDIDHGELGVEHMECPKCAAAGIKLEVGE